MKPLAIGISLVFLLIIGSFVLTFVNPIGMATKMLSPTCIDSDALNFKQNGFININGNAHNDYCKGNVLYEATCSNTRTNYISKDCTSLGNYECSYGRCTEMKYVVAVKNNSSFKGVADYFAKGKKATLIQYANTNDLISKLVKNQPRYLAVVASPEELTPDFLFDLDHKLRRIDSDIFLDVAYGVITSFNEADAYEYVTRILAYKTPEDFSIYMPLRKNTLLNKINSTSLKVKVGCINTYVGYFSFTCNETGQEEHTMDKIVQYSQENQVLWFNAHGAPNKMFFSGDEFIQGNLSGAIGMKDKGEAIYCSCKDEFVGVFKPEEYDLQYEMCVLNGGNNSNGGFGCNGGTFYQEIPFKTTAPLLIADSCITIRINGTPSNNDSTFDPVLSTGENYEIKGEINTSIALSYLKSGALSYLGEGVLAISTFFPEQELVSEALLHSEGVGMALKEYKNKNYLSNSLNDDPFTKKYTDIQVSYWILFGDPALKISKKNERMDSCIKKINPYLKNNVLIYNVTIMFNGTMENHNLEWVSKVEPEEGSGYSTNPISTCLVKVPRTKNQNIKINNFINLEGWGSLNNDNFHWNDGEYEWIVFPKIGPSDQDYTFQVEIS